MTHQEKVNYIKHWLQKFGDRDNEVFYTSLSFDNKCWDLSLQYNYDEDGTQIAPYDWCRSGFKHLRNNQIANRSDEELDKIIEILNEKQKYH